MDEQEFDVGVVADVAAGELGRLPLERLEAEITTLAGHLAAAECRWLLLIAEMDRRRGWASWECRSCAHWLAWKCGLGLRTAHERVRVARALGDLPLVTEAFSTGVLSYSKVRAVTRFVTAATEADVVELATHATAAHLESIAAARARVGNLADADRREAGRFVRWHTDDDATFVLSARLPPELGALVVEAIEAAAASLRRVPEDGEGECSAEHFEVAPGAVVPDDPVGAARADALAAMATAVLTGEHVGSVRGHRHQVVVHTDIDGRGYLHDGPGLLPETIARLVCDSTLVAVAESDDGGLASAQGPSIPAATRRAVTLRDHHRCRWPGCTSRHVDVHHITYRSREGSHHHDNLLLLCRHHHRAVHEGGYRITGPAARAAFLRPDGTALTSRQPAVRSGDAAVRATNERCGVDVTPQTIQSRWTGEALDLHHTIWALLTHEQKDS